VRQDSGARREGGFDAFDLAARQGVLEGDVDAHDLPRVTDRLAEDVSPDQAANAMLHYRIAGARDAAGRPAIRVQVRGSVPLPCQRCLQSFAHAVDQDTLVLVARDEEELAFLDDNDEHEVVLAAGPLHARELVEDELLLSLPFVPRCEREACEAGQGAADGTSAPGASPFAALSALKRGGSEPEDHH